VKLYSIGDRKPVPAERHVVIMCDRLIGAEVERGRQRSGDLALESVAGDVAQLVADRLQTLTFALANLDRE
jgi:hypothetical protein